MDEHSHGINSNLSGKGEIAAGCHLWLLEMKFSILDPERVMKIKGPIVTFLKKIQPFEKMGY